MSLKSMMGGMGGLIGSGAGSAIGGPLGGLLGGGIGNAWDQSQEREFQQQQLMQQINLQKEFAQSGLTWKIDDAAQRGISPLAALGAQGVNFSPMSVGGSGNNNMLSMMGQNLTRAEDATANDEQRTLARLQTQSLQQDIKGKEIDNQLRELELRRASNPPMPTARDKRVIPGQGDSPSKVHNLRDYYKSPQGGYGSLLSGNVKSAVEDTPREWAIDVRDMAHQQINPSSQRFLGKLPPNRKGMRYSFNYPTQEYIEVPAGASIWERLGRHSSYMWK